MEQKSAPRARIPRPRRLARPEGRPIVWPRKRVLLALAAIGALLIGVFVHRSRSSGPLDCARAWLACVRDADGRRMLALLDDGSRDALFVSFANDPSSVARAAAYLSDETGARLGGNKPWSSVAADLVVGAVDRLEDRALVHLDLHGSPGECFHLPVCLERGVWCVRLWREPLGMWSGAHPFVDVPEKESAVTDTPEKLWEAWRFAHIARDGAAIWKLLGPSTRAAARAEILAHEPGLSNAEVLDMAQDSCRERAVAGAALFERARLTEVHREESAAELYFVTPEGFQQKWHAVLEGGAWRIELPSSH
jgi:hypothetical protein